MIDNIKINTKYRNIVSKIPHPESKKIVDDLQKIEPRSMKFSSIVWDSAEGFSVYDGYGNKWIDFTSAIMLANAGHSNPDIGRSIKEQIDKKLMQNYCHPSKIRLDYLKEFKKILPNKSDKIFLLTTGSEAVECSIRLMRQYGQKKDLNKINILSYSNSFHGRTLASLAAGGADSSDKWIFNEPEGYRPKGFYQIPLPDCAFCPWGREKYEDCGSECFEKSVKLLDDMDLEPDTIAGVLTETFRGPTVTFLPIDYARELRRWTRKYDILLAFDEIQAGFGRTGKWFGFEHYGVEADLIMTGKGMTSSLPMSALIGRSEILDLKNVGEMSSTQSGNPLCSAAALANIQVIKKNKLIENSKKLGNIAIKKLKEIKKEFPDIIGNINGRGLMMTFYILHPDKKEKNKELTKKVIEKCIQSGLLLLPTGPNGVIKICPPLCINEEALLEGIGVIRKSLSECIDQG